MGLPWLRTLRRCRTKLLCNEKNLTNCWWMIDLMFLCCKRWSPASCWKDFMWTYMAGHSRWLTFCFSLGSTSTPGEALADLPAAFAQKTSSLGLCKHNTPSRLATYPDKHDCHISHFARALLGFVGETKSVSLVPLERFPQSSFRFCNCLSHRIEIK